MVQDMTEHDHCRFCGDAVPADQAYCSIECYEKDQERIAKERKTEIFWTVLTVVSVVLVLTVGFLI